MANFNISALDHFVGEIQQTGESKFVGLTFPVQTRLQANIYGLVEALTQRAGTSRNKVVNQLIEVGLEATFDALPEDVALELRRVSSQILYEAMSNKDSGAETETM
jgi:hypothetical protein